MKKILMCLLSFLFIGCSTIGGAILLSGCDSSYSDPSNDSGEGSSPTDENEIIDDDPNDVDSNAVIIRIFLRFNGNASGVSNVPSDVEDQVRAPSVTSSWSGSLTIPSTRPTRSGYTFVEWNTSSSGSGTSYSPGDSVTFSYPNISITLYAQWTYNPPTYYITYNSNYPSGTDETYRQAVRSNSSVSILSASSCGFSYTGYNFSRWTTNSNGTGTSYYTGNTYYGSSGSDTLYAQWTRRSYTITFNGNGATGGSTASQTKYYGSSISLRANGFTRTGYTFQGWATSATGGVVYADGGTYSANASDTLYAVWADTTAPTLSRVTYAQNDGTSYYVYAYATDSGSGINRVEFPTWTDYEWQDDIIWHNGTAGSWTVNGQTYNYRYLVKASEHNNEYGKYITHVYAYDNAGNQVGNGSMTNIWIDFDVTVNPNGGTYNGTTSNTTLQDKHGGDVVPLNYTRSGYNLTGVSKSGGGIVSENLLPSTTYTFTGSNYITLGRTYMYSNKLTFALYAYMDNWSQYQSSSMRLISCTQSGGFNIESNGSTVRFAVYDSGKKAYNSITTSVTWSSLSGWVHFAMVFDGTHATGYINGEQVGQSGEFSGNIGYNANNGIFIGAEAGSNTTTPASGYFKGQIRNVHIINDIVNPSDLMKLDCEYALICSGASTVTAQWTAANYTVTYNANGGTLRNYNYASRTSNYSSNDGGVQVNYDATTGIATLNGTLTGNIEITRYYDDFTAGTYTVGWEIVGGSMTRNSGCFAFEFLRSDESSLTNRTNTDIAETDNSISRTLTLSSSMASEAKLLKVWIWYNQAASYVFNNLQIRLFTYLNTPAISSQTVTHGTNTKMAYATKDGAYFTGWNTRADGTGTTYGAGNIGNITSDVTLYAQWTIRNPAYYDSTGGYWYIENGYMPQTKVTNSTTKTNLNNSWNSLPSGSTYEVGGIGTLQSKTYQGKEYCKYNNEYYLVEPIKWRLDYSSSQKSGYGTTTDTLAILDTIVYVNTFSTSAINAGSGYSSTAVNEFYNSTDKQNQFSTTYLVSWTQSMNTFGTSSLYGNPTSVTSNIFVSSVEEIESVAGSGEVKFSDLVTDFLYANGNDLLYYTRDLGSNYNNIVCLNKIGSQTQRMPNLTANRLGVQFTIKVTEYACV